ncbi:hypothetical protein AB0873_22680 [Micromonospora sp. NPDC047707]|uniref:YunG family protein n=1 Tax=Micromonospora sp. NPDC047707 TaxID=3154498 RepID=UPI003455D88B
MIIQDLLGGELILGEVLAGDAKVGYHYWNRLADGREVDLTADQFQPPEVVVGGQVQQRPPGPPRRCRQQYEILRHRVFATLYGGDPTQHATVTAGEQAERTNGGRSAWVSECP